MSDTSKFGFSPELLSLPNQQEYDGTKFPLALRSEVGDIKQARIWIAENAGQIERQAATHGAVLLRGLPLATPEDFDVAVTAFGLPNFAYEDSLSNAVRKVYSPRVFSANEAPPETTIFLHHEMAQTPVYPSKLFFFCQKAAEAGGESPLCRSDALWERIERELPKFGQNCLTKGLKHSNFMPAEADLGSGMGRSWQSTLSVDSRDEAEARLSELEYSWEWMEQDELRVTSPHPAGSPRTGQRKAQFLQPAHRRLQGLERFPKRSGQVDHPWRRFFSRSIGNRTGLRTGGRDHL